MTSKDQERILFLDYLRAIACLLVVFGHIYLMGYNGFHEMSPWVPGLKGLLWGPDAVWRNVFTPPSLFLALQLGINVGALGISLFFLISGFVILRAVERESVPVFLVRRVFRITRSASCRPWWPGRRPPGIAARWDWPRPTAGAASCRPGWCSMVSRRPCR